MRPALNATWASFFGSAVICAPGAVFDNAEGGNHHARAERTDDQEVGPRAHGTEINGVQVSDLLHQLHAGSRDALETLYAALHEPLWRLAMILVRSRDTAEEIVQTVFLMLWTRREHFRPDTDIHAYLKTAVRNEARQLGRHARIVGSVESAVQRQVRQLPGIGQTPLAPDEAIEVKEFWDAYHRALATLTDRERIALQLRLEEELSFEEIGHVLGVSNVGARKIVLRAEAKARRLLLGHEA